jgi:hypothetical protein
MQVRYFPVVLDATGLSFGRRLTHCLMPMTWLFSVSRSIKAAVSW